MQSRRQFYERFCGDAYIFHEREAGEESVEKVRGNSKVQVETKHSQHDTLHADHIIVRVRVVRQLHELLNLKSTHMP